MTTTPAPRTCPSASDGHHDPRLNRSDGAKRPAPRGTDRCACGAVRDTTTAAGTPGDWNRS